MAACSVFAFERSVAPKSFGITSLCFNSPAGLKYHRRFNEEKQHGKAIQFWGVEVDQGKFGGGDRFLTNFAVEHVPSVVRLD